MNCSDDLDCPIGTRCLNLIEEDVVPPEWKVGCVCEPLTLWKISEERNDCTNLSTGTWALFALNLFYTVFLTQRVFVHTDTFLRLRTSQQKRQKEVFTLTKKVLATVFVLALYSGARAAYTISPNAEHDAILNGKRQSWAGLVSSTCLSLFFGTAFLGAISLIKLWLETASAFYLLNNDASYARFASGMRSFLYWYERALVLLCLIVGILMQNHIMLGKLLLPFAIAFIFALGSTYIKTCHAFRIAIVNLGSSSSLDQEGRKTKVKEVDESRYLRKAQKDIQLSGAALIAIICFVGVNLGTMILVTSFYSHEYWYARYLTFSFHFQIAAFVASSMIASLYIAGLGRNLVSRMKRIRSVDTKAQTIQSTSSQPRFRY